MGELAGMTPTETLDVLGRVCPYPLVLTKKALEKLPGGSLLKILCDAPASAKIPCQDMQRGRDTNLSP